MTTITFMCTIQLITWDTSTIEITRTMPLGDLVSTTVANLSTKWCLNLFEILEIMRFILMLLNSVIVFGLDQSLLYPWMNAQDYAF